MNIAAVPQYLGQNFSSASPGLRFGLFLRAWNPDFGMGKDNKVKALAEVGKLNPADKKLMQAIAERQNQMASQHRDSMLSLEAIATAPFTTGLGNAHPLENGFAFLNPYGLPYLPGSGIKGVLRQAARELTSGDWRDVLPAAANVCSSQQQNWLEILFGKGQENDDSKHLRGVLQFWDALPELRDDKLAVDIMTPHQTHYYQGTATPHDSGQPNPIPFLTLPPGTRFVFHVCCDKERLQRLAPALLENNHWRELLQTLFAHAFAWLGFGAKTAVGYGAMCLDAQAMKRQAMKQQAEQAAAAAAAAAAEYEQRMAQLSPQQRQIAEFEAQCEEKLQAIQNSGHRKEANTFGSGLLSTASKLSKDAQASTDWTEQDRKSLAEALEHWLRQVVEKLDDAKEWKEVRKKLQLTKLKGE